LKNIYKNKLLAGGAAILLASIINRLIIYGLVPVYTNVLSPSAFGIIGYYQAVLLVLQIVIGLGLYGVQTRLYHDFKHDKKELGTLLFNLNFLVASAGMALALINYAFAEVWWANLVENETEVRIIKLLPFIALFQALSINNNNFRLVQQQFKNLFIQKVTEAILVAAFILFFLLFKKDGAIADFKGTLWGTGICLIIFYPSYFSNFFRQFKPQIIRSAFALGLPLVLHSGANILVNIGDRFLIKHFLGNAEVGIYTLAYQIGQIMSVVSTSLNQSWQAQFLKNSIDEPNYNPNNEVLQIGLANTIIGVYITAGTLLFFDLMFDIRYSLVKTITPIIVVSYLVNYFYYTSSSIIFLHKKNSILATITVATLGVNLLLNTFLIPQFGILGAAFATIITMLFRAGTTIGVANRLQEKGINYTKPFIVIALGSSCITATIFFQSTVAIILCTLTFLVPAKLYFFKLLKRK
jgi:O-antigen/teichoic acid export membrane protein